MTSRCKCGRPPLALTEDETAAIEYAVAWLRAFPVLPTSKPEVREERSEVVARLDAIARRERGR